MIEPKHVTLIAYIRLPNSVVTLYKPSHYTAWGEVRSCITACESDYRMIIRVVRPDDTVYLIPCMFNPDYAVSDQVMEAFAKAKGYDNMNAALMAAMHGVYHYVRDARTVLRGFTSLPD